jgi:hypothetical protein
VYRFSAGFLKKSTLEKRAVSETALEKRADFRTPLSGKHDSSAP